MEDLIELLVAAKKRVLSILVASRDEFRIQVLSDAIVDRYLVVQAIDRADRRLRMEDLSGDLEFDVIVFVHRTDESLEFIVAKNDRGSIGIFEILSREMN